MKNGKWKAYLVFILITEAIGALSGIISRSGIETYSQEIIKPALTPPAILFPIVWSILYALMGIGAARIWLAEQSPERTKSLWIYFEQLGINFFWSIFFFNFQAFAFSFFWLCLLWIFILWMILSFRKVDRAAAYIQIPYLIWVTWAGYLNFGVWMLNR